MHTDITVVPRACGECTACCKILEVEELGKAAGVWCDACVIGRGCAAYAERPLLCRSWNCEWKEGFGPAGMRPDRSKIVFKHETSLEELGIPFMRAYEIREGVFDDPILVQDLLYEASQPDVRMAFVLMPLRRKQRIFVPRERVLEQVAEKMKVFQDRGCEVAVFLEPMRIRGAKVLAGS